MQSPGQRGASGSQRDVLLHKMIGMKGMLRRGQKVVVLAAALTAGEFTLTASCAEWAVAGFSKANKNIHANVTR
jgi:hypothetical protein